MQSGERYHLPNSATGIAGIPSPVCSARRPVPPSPYVSHCDADPVGPTVAAPCGPWWRRPPVSWRRAPHWPQQQFLPCLSLPRVAGPSLRFIISSPASPGVVALDHPGSCHPAQVIDTDDLGIVGSHQVFLSQSVHQDVDLRSLNQEDKLRRFPSIIESGLDDGLAHPHREVPVLPLFGLLLEDLGLQPAHHVDTLASPGKVISGDDGAVV